MTAVKKDEFVDIVTSRWKVREDHLCKNLLKQIMIMSYYNAAVTGKM